MPLPAYKLIESGPTNLRTQRLILLCRALKGSEAVDAALGKMLVDRANAVRQFVQAAAYQLARDTLDSIDKTAVDGGAQPAAQTAIEAATKAVREVLR